MLEGLLTELSKNGPWAILLGLAILAMYFLFNKYTDSIKRNDELQEKRLDDFRVSSGVNSKLIESVKQNTDLIIQSLLNKRKGE